MSSVEVVEQAGGSWSFRFDDGVVTEIRVGHRVVLVMNDGLIGLEQPFTLHRDGDTTLVPPGDVLHEVADALPLLHQRILHANASAEAILRLTFEDGPVIEIGTHPSGLYEGWQVELDDRVWVGIGNTVGQSTFTRAQASASPVPVANPTALEPSPAASRGVDPGSGGGATHTGLT